ncbi:MAG: T9SS type A sorting domain-containing protein, partial [Bacteroidota bacterium]
IARKGEILVFPNPASERVFWTKQNADAPEFIRLYNTLGQLQLEQQTSDGFIDVKNLAGGVYHLVVQSASGSVRSANFVIQH